MFRTHDRKIVGRVSAIAAASALALGGTLALAGPAHAEGVKGEFKGFADVTGDNKEDSLGLFVKGYKHGDKVVAGLMDLKLETGETLKVYCVDIETGTEGGNKYAEGEWGTTWPSGADAAERRAKIKWILLNSFPTVSVDTLKTKVGIEGLDAQEAAAATQAAIWHFSDKIDLNDAGKGDVTKLYDHLVKSATATDNNEPKISLELTPEEQSGSPAATPGVGPFTVKTNAEGKVIEADLKAGAPAGTTLVGKDGKAVTKVGNGDELYVKPAAGSETGEATVEVSGKSKLDAGRIFNGTKKGTSQASQKLILAEHQTVTAKADAKAKWAAKGALPAFTAKQICAEGGVEVTTKNNGDMPFEFTLDNKKSTVKPGDTAKQVVKIEEDQAYTIKILGPDNKTLKEFSGVLDCKTASTTGGGGSTPTPSAPAPSAPAPAPAPSGPSLAETGGSDSSSGLYLGGGAVLLLGGGLVFFVMRRRAAQ
ncbi:thioester domain-containing protein [Streptodolium elevatio]|uniref:Thioester domain-containing protein n=1 Tax=Streptodolium elevatio TaxID=3157996 RepID=A0ABV3DKJ6_9ACTN